MSEQEQAQKEAAVAAKQAEIDAINEKRSGKGLRLKVSQTRGRNPQVIVYEHFDQEKADTLPTTLEEFASLTGVSEEADILSMVIDGYNDRQYSLASDVLNEFVESSWTPEYVKQFKMVVRNYAAMNKLSIEDAVNALKPLLNPAK